MNVLYVSTFLDLVDWKMCPSLKSLLGTDTKYQLTEIHQLWSGRRGGFHLIVTLRTSVNEVR